MKIAKYREDAPPIDSDDEDGDESYHPFLLTRFWTFNFSRNSPERMFVKSVKETVKFLLLTATIDYQQRRSCFIEANHSNALRKKESEAVKKLTLTTATENAISKINDGDKEKTANDIIKGAVKEALKTKGVKWKDLNVKANNEQKNNKNNNKNNKSQTKSKKRKNSSNVHQTKPNYPKGSGGPNKNGRSQPLTTAGFKNHSLITKAGLLAKKRKLEEHLKELNQQMHKKQKTNTKAAKRDNQGSRGGKGNARNNKQSNAKKGN